MNILGIETSCDETSAAVVKDGRFILSNVIASSVKEHELYGGVIPEIASRRQLEYIFPVVEQSLEKASVNLSNIDAIAYTAFPGLIGSLLVGISFAKGLSLSLNKPLIPVNHIQAHLYANYLVEVASTGSDAKKNSKSLPSWPAIGLVVSGGHTSLFEIKSPQNIRELGATRDDAVGEAFDKVARIMNLGYPGGPIIDRMAQKVAYTDLKFKSADLKNSYDFSFSGVKTAVLYHHQKTEVKYSLEEVAYAFETSVIDVIVKKSIEACLNKRIKTLVVGGGVAANSMLRQKLHKKASEKGIKVYFPPMSLCLDNAAMIAGYAFHCQN